MEAAKKAAIMNCSTFDELLDVEYGKVGTPNRDQFENEALAFCVTVCSKSERKKQDVVSYV